MAHNGGLLQVNIDFAAAYSVYWTIDPLRMAGGFDSRPRFAGTVNTDDWPLKLDANGYPQEAPPDGASNRWYRPFYILGEVGTTYDFFYPAAKGTFGISSLTGGLTLSTANITGGQRITITALPADTPTGLAPVLCYLEITDLTAPILPGELYMYRTDHAALYAAGEILHPEFLATLDDPANGGVRGWGKIRWMNGQLSNETLERSPANRITLNDVGWGAKGPNAETWTGTATQTKNAYTTGTRIPTNPVAWVDGQKFHCRAGVVLTKLVSNSITRGATTTIVFTGAHGLSDGDLISFADTFNSYGTGWRFGVDEPVPIASQSLPNLVSGNLPEFPVTVTAADTVTIPLDSSTFDALASASFYPTLTITDGTLPAKRMYCDLQMTHPHPSIVMAATDIMTCIYNEDFDCVIYKFNSDADSTRSGIPIEILVEAANKINSHLDVTMPPQANQALRREIMQVCKDGLNAGLIPDFERLNEPWSTGFACFRYQRAVASKQTGAGSNAAYGHGEMFMAMKDDAAAIFGSDRPYELSINFQAAISATVTFDSWLKGNPNLHGGNTALYPGNNADAVGMAYYYLVEFNYSATAADYPGWQDALNLWLTGTASNKAAAFEWFGNEFITASTPGANVNAQITEHLPVIAQQFIEIASYTGRQGAGLKIKEYEGGPHTFGANQLAGGFPTGGITVQNVYDFYFEYLESVKHADVQQYYFESLMTAGVVYPSQFTISAPWGYTNLWGAQRFNSYPAPVLPNFTRLVEVNNGGAEPEPTPTPPSGGGGAAHPTKIKAEEERRKRLKKNDELLEQTIRLAHQRLTGKITEPPILKDNPKPERLAIHAKKMAQQLVEKSKESAKLRTRNKQIIADLRRLADEAQAERDEEELIIVSLLLH